MRRKWLWSGILLAFLTGGAGLAWAAQSKTPSLGALARKLRAQQAQGQQKPVKVYTNDNIPKTGDLSTTTMGTSQASQQAENGNKETESTAGTHNEEYYRTKLKELQDQKEMHQRELAVLEQKIGVNQTQYFPDPTKTLQQESTPAFFSDQATLRKELEAKKKQIAEDQTAIDDLHAQCNREGCPPGWLR